MRARSAVIAVVASTASACLLAYPLGGYTEQPPLDGSSDRVAGDAFGGDGGGDGDGAFPAPAQLAGRANLAVGQVEIRAVDVDDTFAFWTALGSPDGGVWRDDKNTGTGTPTALLLAANAKGIAVDDRVYFAVDATGDASVSAMRKDGSDVVTLATSRSAASRVALDADTVYCSTFP